jgi:MoaA/NifB/PqqE/SkfB family radical SAM enzyme
MEPNVLRAPISVLLELTSACNLRCKHCMTGDHGAVYVRSERALLKVLRDELPTEAWKRIIDEAAELKVLVLFLSGGEPLMHPDFFEIAAHAHQHGLFTCLLTAASLVDDDMARRIKQAGVNKIEANLDSADPEVYDDFRGVKGAYEATVRGLKALLNVGFSVRVNITLTNMTFPTIERTLERVYDIGVREVVVVPLRPSGRALDFEERLEYTPQQYFKMLERLRELRQAFADRLLLSFEFDDNFARISNPVRMIPRDGAGRIHCSVTPDGLVKLEPETPSSAEWIAGDLKRQSLAEVWRDSPLFARMRDPESPAFQGCTLNDCVGGCPMRAWKAHGGFLKGRDPFCPFCHEVGKEFLGEAEGDGESRTPEAHPCSPA